MLRLWRAGNDGKPVWRASLKHPLTRERLGFAGLRELFAYLEAQIEEADLSSEEGPDEPRMTSGNSNGRPDCR
ncbi:MAG: hypothetical protein GWN58_22185 [Anaerolineae bacterium]|nr:hypothetical protein [Anaerolineae bacterium]